MSDRPDSFRTDVLPSKNPTAEKKKSESFNTAFNTPNNPKHEDQPTSFNVTDDYGHGYDPDHD